MTGPEPSKNSTAPSRPEVDAMEHWIIVGAGSAGCVLANRLSADGTRSITLIEAGPDLVEGQVPPAIDGPNFIHALGLADRTYPDLLARRTPASEPIVYRRGRGVGGSSAVNAMVALRGSPAIYAQWGWHDLDELWDQSAIPESVAAQHELGAVDRALLQASANARQAPLTRRDGRRISSAEAYLWPATGRSNLTTLTDTAVNHVLIANYKACGVQLEDGTELAADHIVIAAGAIHSPALLLRSHVAVAGIGEGLQDHPAAMLTLQLRPDAGEVESSLPIASLLEIPVGDDLIQLLPMNVLGPEAPGFGGLLVALMTPTSTAGIVTIDDSGSPVVDFHLLDDQHDLELLTQAVRHGLDLLGQPAFADIVQQVYIDDVGSTADSLSTDEAIATWLRGNCADYVHASSTCAMGTVVDDHFAVVGYQGLFVCDASVFPSIPDVNTHLPTTLAAERFARIHC